MLANKFQKKLGYFLLEFDHDLRELVNYPWKVNSKFKYIIKWINKLNIGDAQLFVMISKVPRSTSINNKN